MTIKKTITWLYLIVLAFVCSGIYFSYRASLPTPGQEMAASITENLDRELNKLDQYVNTYSIPSGKIEFASLENLNAITFCVLTDQQISYWSSNRYLPGVRFMMGDYHAKHIKTGIGDFLLRKWVINTTNSLIAIIPLHIQYKIQNEYLEPSLNQSITGNYQVVILDRTAVEGYPIAIKGETLFRIMPISAEPAITFDGILALLSFTITLILLVVLFIPLVTQWRRINPAISFLILFTGIVSIRYLMVLTRIPSRFLNSELFDAKNFASSEFNSSMSEMILNLTMVLILCIYLAFNYFRFKGLRRLLSDKKWNSIISVFSVCALLFGILFPFVVIQTLYNNSTITLNVSESVSFNVVRIAAFISILISCISGFLFSHLFLRLLLRNKTINKIILFILAGSLIFIGINELSGQYYLSSLLCGLLYIVLVWIFNLVRTLQKFQYRTFLYFFLAILVFSINTYFATWKFNNIRMERDQARFATIYLIERDDFGEFLLNETINRISRDLFIQTRMYGPFLNKEAVTQKIRQVFIPGYFNKYNVTIMLFNAEGNAMDDLNPYPLRQWMFQSGVDTTEAIQQRVYFINRERNETSSKYVVLIPIHRSDILAGYVGLSLSLKSLIPETVYPELLVDNRFQKSYRSKEYSYAVISDGSIQFQSGELNYNYFNMNQLENPKLFSTGLYQNGYRHIGSKDTSGRIVLVSAPLPSMLLQIADYSFFIIIGLAAVLFFLLIIGLVDFLRNERLLLAARIQLVLNLSFFVPLIIVSLMTLGLTAKTNQDQLNTEYLTKSQHFSRELSLQVSESLDSDPALAEQNFSQLASISNLDANYFTINGRLQFSSQPMIFENQLLSPFINPHALTRILQSERSFVTREQVGNLVYNVAYSAVISPKDGTLLGIAAVPFYQSAYLLEKMQIQVLANIISVFTIIFIVLLIISYWVSTWLTFPLRMITQKLGRISLIQSNQPLEWKSDDEIGIMVKEYNHMLSTLSNNKRELERVQRERAWREIAQQVAHEIKNPLTPIKLTFQQLERLNDQDPRKMEKLRTAIATVLSQVEILDGVASSFSTFAKMPEPVLERIELISLLVSCKSLHEQSADIVLDVPRERIEILADQKLLGRIFSNLVLNAIQSARSDSSIKVKISVKVSDNRVTISFTDNGSGIPESLKDKIFLPHFSTKQTGSGLGLAIAKQGIEQMGGAINFESKLGEGSTFWMEFPIIKT